MTCALHSRGSFGGKSRAAPLIWERFGRVENVVEPFAGSLAVLLARPDEPGVETVNDVDGHLCNFFRSVQRYPEQVAEAADGPVNELDLHARHRYLTKMRGKLAARLEADPFYCNHMVAGWWVWGISAWIGSGWCSGEAKKKAPDIGSRGGSTDDGRGVHGKKMRRQIQDVGGNGDSGGRGRGVHSKALRVSLAGGGEGFPGQGPHPYPGRGVNGAGFRRQLPHLLGQAADGNNRPDYGKGIHGQHRRSALYELFDLLSRRLRYVRVVCGDWRRIMTPSVTWKHGMTGVVLDPPYDGYESLYADGQPVSASVRQWCIEEATNGQGAKLLRVALCGYEGEHNELEALGWTKVAWKAHGGMGNQSGDNENAHRERIWFSPACLGERQRSLF